MASVTFLVVATNAYLPLGVRLVKRFNHFYHGEDAVTIHLLTDEELEPYLPPGNWARERRIHTNWVEGTSSKFKELITLSRSCDTEYLYVLDADTSFNRPFDLKWLLGDTVACEHFGNRDWMADNDKKNYERNRKSLAYVPYDTPHPQMYYMGMLIGGKTTCVEEFSTTMLDWQTEDTRTGNPACVQDESYINKYFHVNPPSHVVPTDGFPWVISDKGGLGETRNVNLGVSRVKAVLQEFRDRPLIDIRNNVVSAVN